MMKSAPLTDDEVRDLRQIRDAYRAGRFVWGCIIGLGSFVGAILGIWALWHGK